MVGADRRLPQVRRPSEPEANPWPQAVGYLRLHTGDPPEVAVALAAELLAYADKEYLALADVYTDPFDTPVTGAERAGFCALMDTLRRHDTYAVIIPAPQHLSRRPASYTSRRTIIEIEAGARLLVIHT